MSKQTTLHISILGGIWWPMGLQCSLEKKIQLGKGPFQVDIEPTFDDVEDWIMSNSGDFSSVDDWNCEMEVTTWKENKHITEYSTLKDWNNEDLEMAYFDTIAEYVE